MDNLFEAGASSSSSPYSSHALSLDAKKSLSIDLNKSTPFLDGLLQGGNSNTKTDNGADDAGKNSANTKIPANSSDGQTPVMTAAEKRQATLERLKAMREKSASVDTSALKKPRATW
jgi:hypothetical protein